jgi:transcription-repair coupling factor (superfamily II helicase)
MPVQPHVYDEFCARFPYEETEDQLGAINATLKDLESGRPMDRLICGDVGFGKTEVALRAAFASRSTASRSRSWCRPRCWRGSTPRPSPSGFAAFPSMSRRPRGWSRQGTEPGQEGPRRRRSRHRRRHPCAARQVDQVQGSRPLIVDEEQHFGVSHKERLKQLRAEVHVLTLSATPIRARCNWRLTGCARSVDHRLAAVRPPRGAHLRGPRTIP